MSWTKLAKSSVHAIPIRGYLKVNRLPSGVASSPALWLRTIDSILKDLPGFCCLVNDILVAAKTESEHLSRLKVVFKRLQDIDVHISSLRSVYFLQKKFLTSDLKLPITVYSKLMKKSRKLKKSPAATNGSDVRSFLGLITFYSKFVLNLATIAAPIYQLTHKNVLFDWNKACQTTFQTLIENFVLKVFFSIIILIYR